MFILKSVRLILCLFLTVIIWTCLVLPFCFIFQTQDFPNPKHTYTFIKESLTNAVKGTIDFLKRELFN